MAFWKGPNYGHSKEGVDCPGRQGCVGGAQRVVRAVNLLRVVL